MGPEQALRRREPDLQIFWIVAPGNDFNVGLGRSGAS